MWFNKEKKKVNADLPILPELPDLPELHPISPSSPSPKMRDNLAPKRGVSPNLPALPSFKSSETANSLGNEAIKSALESPISSKQFSFIKEKETYTKEMPLAGQEEEERQENESELLRPLEYNQRIPVATSKIIEKSPVFVRIDKFQLALKNLKEVKMQISGIESYLKEIKSIKEKEEAELNEWESQISNIKSKLDSIENSVFSKLD